MIRDITDIYNRNLIQILWISLVIVIPYSLFILSAINYFYVIDTVELSNLMAVYLIIMNFTALFPPFFYVAKNDMQDHSYRLGDVIKVFFKGFGPIAFFTLLFYLIAMIGSMLLFIPTIIAGIIIFLYPLFCDTDHICNTFRGIWETLKSEHVFILVDILIIVSLNLLIWSSSLYLLSVFENNSLVYVTIRVLLNALFLPFIYFYLTIKYRKDLGEAYGK